MHGSDRVRRILPSVCCGVQPRGMTLARSAYPICPHLLSSAFARRQVGLLRTEQDNSGSYYIG